MDAQEPGAGPELVPPGAPSTAEFGSVQPGGLESVERELARLADLTIAEHVEVFSGIHQQLTSALAMTGGNQQPVNQQNSNQQNSNQQNSNQQGSRSPGRPGQSYQQRSR